MLNKTDDRQNERELNQQIHPPQPLTPIQNSRLKTPHSTELSAGQINDTLPLLEKPDYIFDWVWEFGVMG